MSVIFKAQVPRTYQASNQFGGVFVFVPSRSITILQIYVIHTIAFLLILDRLLGYCTRLR